MAVLRRSRSHLVTFRLSEHEFDKVKQTCIENGARSLSEFTRAAVLEKMGAVDHPTALLSLDLSTIARELRELDDAMKDLSQKIGRVLGPDRSGSPAPSMEPEDVGWKSHSSR
jgi:hypothetical protein